MNKNPLHKKISQVMYSINLSAFQSKDKLELILKNILELLSNNDPTVNNVVRDFLNSNYKTPRCIEFGNLESIITMELSQVGETLNVELEINIS